MDTILGIETSCDETAAAVYSITIRSNVLYSQIDLHAVYGGVLPELASRAHLEKIDIIVHQALKRAHTTLEDIDVVAVTNRPGLAGSLLVGVCFAKGLAWAGNKKIIAVNHLEGHIFSPFLEYDVPFPYLCLTASGGHTSLYVVHDFGKFTLLGTTLDDAAGEAFDKVAKLIGLPYPGGPEIEKLAAQIGFKDYYQYPRGKKSLNFSFSGLKTAVLYDLVKRGAYDLKSKQFLKPDDMKIKQRVASSLLVCIADIFVHKVQLALQETKDIRAIVLVGGVACNRYIQRRLQEVATNQELLFFYPSRQYCTDNAAMIAFVGSYKANQGHFDSFDFGIR
jgi:N6-L-threonylcarbamoyladenine synthase